MNALKGLCSGCMNALNKCTCVDPYLQGILKRVYDPSPTELPAPPKEPEDGRKKAFIGMMNCLRSIASWCADPSDDRTTSDFEDLLFETLNEAKTILERWDEE